MSQKSTGKNTSNIKAKRSDRENPLTIESDWVGATVRVNRVAVGEVKRRGPNKAPTKPQISLRLPNDTLLRWRATGKGWQTRAAALLTANAP